MLVVLSAHPRRSSVADDHRPVDVIDSPVGVCSARTRLGNEAGSRIAICREERAGPSGLTSHDKWWNPRSVRVQQPTVATRPPGGSSSAFLINPRCSCVDRHIGLFVQQQPPFSRCPGRLLVVRPLSCGMARADLAVVLGRPPGRLPASNVTIESDGHLIPRPAPAGAQRDRRVRPSGHQLGRRLSRAEAPSAVTRPRHVEVRTA